MANELDDPKTKLAKSMAKAESGPTAQELPDIGKQAQLSQADQSSVPAGRGPGYDPGRWGEENPYGVDLGFFGARFGGKNNPMNDPNYWLEYEKDPTSAQARYDAWLYGGNDKYANSITTPLQRLQYQTDQEAKNYEKNLEKTKAEGANLLKTTADRTLSQGIHNTRRSANNRGLLYSNIRQGDESDVRGRVSGLLARQIADSNADFDKSLTARKQTAAAMRIGAAEQAQARQAEIDLMRQQNQTARAQQMQQLIGVVGYAGGRYLNSDSGATADSMGPVNSQSLTMPEVGSSWRG